MVYTYDFTNQIIDIPEGDDISKGLSISNVDAYLADLDNLSVFDEISGIIVGKPYNYSNNENQQLKEILIKYTKDKSEFIFSENTKR
mgnify:CR=1 FL=1